MTTNPPNAIDREQLQETYDAAERMLHGEHTSSPGPKVACPSHRGLVSEWLRGGLTRFIAALTEKANDDCPRSS